MDTPCICLAKDWDELECTGGCVCVLGKVLLMTMCMCALMKTFLIRNSFVLSCHPQNNFYVLLYDLKQEFLSHSVCYSSLP